MPGISPPTQVATAASAALTSSETSSRKPVAATSPIAAALAITKRVMVSPSGVGAFQISLSEVCSSPNTPLAVSSRVTTLTTRGDRARGRLAAPLTIACTASALCAADQALATGRRRRPPPPAGRRPGRRWRWRSSSSGAMEKIV